MRRRATLRTRDVCVVTPHHSSWMKSCDTYSMSGLWYQKWLDIAYSLQVLHLQTMHKLQVLDILSQVSSESMHNLQVDCPLTDAHNVSSDDKARRTFAAQFAQVGNHNLRIWDGITYFN